MGNINYNRQEGLIDIKDFRDNKVAIIGCGAVGSFVGISLAKMGLTKFNLVDFDVIEEHNIPNQFCGIDDDGYYKTAIVKQYMRSFNNEVEIIEQRRKFRRVDVNDCSIVISCVDKMDVRKEIFEVCKKNDKVQLFIDTRMSGLQGQVYSIDMAIYKEVENYEKTLFSDKEAVQERCTEKSIIFTVLGVSSLVCNQVKKALKEEEIKNYIVLDYSVPQMV